MSPSLTSGGWIVPREDHKADVIILLGLMYISVCFGDLSIYLVKVFWKKEPRFDGREHMPCSRMAESTCPAPAWQGPPAAAGQGFQWTVGSGVSTASPTARPQCHSWFEATESIADAGTG